MRTTALLFILVLICSCSKETDLLIQSECELHSDGSFVNEPEKLTYIMIPLKAPYSLEANQEERTSAREYTRELITKVCLGSQLRANEIFLKNDPTKRFIVVRKFKNMKAAEKHIRKLKRKLSNEDLAAFTTILPITQKNYRRILRGLELDDYRIFYLSEIK